MIGSMGYESPTYKWFARWWFPIFFIFTPIWGNDPILLIFFNWVETTNQFVSCCNKNPETNSKTDLKIGHLPQKETTSSIPSIHIFRCYVMLVLGRVAMVC